MTDREAGSILFLAEIEIICFLFFFRNLLSDDMYQNEHGKQGKVSLPVGFLSAPAPAPAPAAAPAPAPRYLKRFMTQQKRRTKIRTLL